MFTMNSHQAEQTLHHVSGISYAIYAKGKQVKETKSITSPQISILCCVDGVELGLQERENRKEREEKAREKATERQRKEKGKGGKRRP